jgi:hypothetical protein
LKQPYRQPNTLKAGGLINIANPDRVDQCPLSLFGGPEGIFRADVVKRRATTAAAK